MDTPQRKPKIINLILYSSGDDCYEMMAETLTKYLHAKKIEHYFYSYQPDLKEDYVIRDNHLIIRGIETMVPGILEKTLQALEIFQDREYDFIVRTNISTVINFDIAFKDIPMECDYAALIIPGWKENDKWLPTYGITPQNHAKYHTHHWPVGIFIVFSRKAVKMLIEDRGILHAYGTIDDRAIGSYFHERKGTFIETHIPHNRSISNATSSHPDFFIYRNKTENRATDVCRMNTIISQLLGT